jgi:hypothetical protein
VDGFLENELVFGRVKFILDMIWICLVFFFKKNEWIGTNIGYIMSYMTCEYKHDAIKPLIPNQSINLDVHMRTLIHQSQNLETFYSNVKDSN